MRLLAQSETLLYRGIITIFFTIILFSDFLSASFWLDECTAAWVTNDSLIQSFIRANDNLWQSSLYYCFIWLWRNLFGNSELILRLPSFLATITSVYMIYLIGKLIKNELCGICAALVYLLRDGIVIEAAISARSYALAILATLFATYNFLKWIKNRDDKFLIYWLLCIVLAIYLHYMYGGILFIHLLLFKAYNCRISKKHFLSLFFTGLILLTPTFPHIIHILSGDSIVYSHLPNVSFLLYSYSIPLSLILFINLLFVTISKSHFKTPIMNQTDLFNNSSQYSHLHLNPFKINLFLVFVLATFLPNLLLFFVCHITELNFFHIRYIFWTAPFLALTLGSILSSIRPTYIRCSIVLFIAIFGFDYLRHQPRPPENWREATKYIQERSTAKTLVLSYSGYIESDRLLWLTDTRHKLYLSAPLQYYQIQVPVIPLPSYFLSSLADNYLKKEILTKITQYNDVYFVALKQAPFFNSHCKQFKYSFECQLKTFKQHNLQFNEIAQFDNVILFKLNK